MSEHRLEHTLACLRQLGEMGEARFNLSPIEDLSLYSPEWLEHAPFVQLLDRLRPDIRFFYGDIYARFG